MICPNCSEKTEAIKSLISKGEILTGCQKCLTPQLQKGSGTNHSHFKRVQQTKFRRELTQPVAPREYISAFGADAARERGYTDEQIRKFSN